MDERREVDLNALVEEALNLAYHGARAQDAAFNITLERDFGPVIAPIEVAPQEMTRVFLNLFGNGFYAASKRARGDGEALRNDEECSYVSAWEHTGPGRAPALHKEPLTFEAVKPTVRSYK